jgi:hypothetical protein
MSAIQHSAMVHLLITCLSLYCFFVFSYWWIKIGTATFIYATTTFLLMGVFLNHLGTLIAYVDYMDDNVMQVIDCAMWPLKTYPILLALIIYAVHITWKIKNSSNK